MKSRSLVPSIIVIAVVICAIIAYNSIRAGGRHVLKRNALVNPRFSPWKRLLNCGRADMAFIENCLFNCLCSINGVVIGSTLRSAYHVFCGLKGTFERGSKSHHPLSRSRKSQSGLFW